MEPWVRAFLIILGGLALFVQPGPFINDEVGQMAALTSLANDSLLVTADQPQGYDAIRDWGGNVVPPPGGNPRINAGSNMLNILALPVLGILQGLAVVLGPMGAVAVPTAAALGAGLWAWRGDRWLAAAAASALFMGALIMQTTAQPPASPYLEAAALQWVNIGFHAFASALLFDVFRGRVARPTMVAALYAFGTPAMFWGLNLKYHAIAISLGAICIWLYQDGARTRPARTALAFAVAGLALWNHLPNGILVFASLGLMALPAVLLHWRSLAARASAGVAGLAVGLLPEVWDRMAHEALEQPDRFIQISTAPSARGEVVGQVAEQVARQSEAGRLQWAVWNDPSGTTDAAWQLFVWPDVTVPHMGMALPLLALLPVIVLAAWPHLRRPHGGYGWTLRVWPIVHLVVLLGLFGQGIFLSGGGFDMRQASTIWPFAVVAIAPIVGHASVRRRLVARIGALLVAALAVLVWIPFALARRVKGISALEQGPIADMIEPLRFIGMVVAAATLIVWVWPRMRPWRAHAVCAALAWSGLVQFLLQVGPARAHIPGVSFPFVAWPMALLEALLEPALMPLPY